MAVNKVVMNTASGEETLIDLTSDTITPETLVSGTTAHNKAGMIIVGTNPYEKTETDNTVATQASLILQIAEALEGKAAGGSGGSTETEDSLIDGSITSYTNNRVLTIRSYAFTSNKNIQNVNFPAAQTIGAYAFSGCSNLTSASFPVASSMHDGVFTRCYALASADFPNVTRIPTNAFYSCSKLTEVSIPAASSIGTMAFYGCSKLTSAIFPAVTSIGNSAFYNCSSLTTASFPVAKSIASSVFAYCRSLATISFPAVTYIGAYAFMYCDSLTNVSFPAASTIVGYAFRYCYNLSNLYLMGSTVCTLSNSTAFSSTPYAGYSGSFSGTPRIYVPASLLTSYQTATNWTYFSSYFSGI